MQNWARWQTNTAFQFIYGTPNMLTKLKLSTLLLLILSYHYLVFSFLSYSLLKTWYNGVNLCGCGKSFAALIANKSAYVPKLVNGCYFRNFLNRAQKNGDFSNPLHSTSRRVIHWSIWIKYCKSNLHFYFFGSPAVWFPQYVMTRESGPCKNRKIRNKKLFSEIL